MALLSSSMEKFSKGATDLHMEAIMEGEAAWAVKKSTLEAIRARCQPAALPAKGRSTSNPLVLDRPEATLQGYPRLREL